MTTGDVFLIIWVAAGVRIMYLLCKLWAQSLGSEDKEYWDACMIERNHEAQSFDYADIT